MNYPKQLTKILKEESKARAKRWEMKVAYETWSSEAQLFFNDVIRPIIAKRKIIEQIISLESQLNELKTPTK